MIEQFDRYIPTSETLSQREQIKEQMMKALQTGNISRISKLGDLALETVHPTASLFERWETLADVTPYHIPQEALRRSMQVSRDNKIAIAREGKKAYLYINSGAIIRGVQKEIENLPDEISRDELLASIITELLAKTTDPKQQQTTNLHLSRLTRHVCEQFYRENGPIEVPPALKHGDVREDDPTPAIAAQAFLTRDMGRVLDQLPAHMVEILGLRYGFNSEDDEKTQEETSKIKGVSSSRIGQIEAHALRMLRHPSRSRRLRDYLDIPDNVRGREEPRRLGHWFLVPELPKMYHRRLPDIPTQNCSRPKPIDIAQDYHFGKAPISVGTWKRLISAGIAEMGDFLRYSPDKLTEMWQAEGYNTPELTQVIKKVVLDDINELTDPFKPLTLDNEKKLVYLSDSVISNNEGVFEDAQVHKIEQAAITSHGSIKSHLYDQYSLDLFSKIPRGDWRNIEIRGRRKVLEYAIVKLREFFDNA